MFVLRSGLRFSFWALEAWTESEEKTILVSENGLFLTLDVLIQKKKHCDKFNKSQSMFLPLVFYKRRKIMIDLYEHSEEILCQ